MQPNVGVERPCERLIEYRYHTEGFCVQVPCAVNAQRASIGCPEGASKWGRSRRRIRFSATLFCCCFISCIVSSRQITPHASPHGRPSERAPERWLGCGDAHCCAAQIGCIRGRGLVSAYGLSTRFALNVSGRFTYCSLPSALVSLGNKLNPIRAP